MKYYILFTSSNWGEDHRILVSEKDLTRYNERERWNLAKVLGMKHLGPESEVEIRETKAAIQIT